MVKFQNFWNRIPAAFFAAFKCLKKAFFSLLSVAPYTVSPIGFTPILPIMPPPASGRAKALFPHMGCLNPSDAAIQALKSFFGNLWFLAGALPRAMSPVCVASNSGKFFVADTTIEYNARKMNAFWHWCGDASHI